MSDLEQLRSLGMLVEPNFFDWKTCNHLRTEAATASTIEAAVASRIGSLPYVAEMDRKTKVVAVQQLAVALVKARFQELRPRLETHFGVLLSGCELPQFLAYETGGFYRVHVDRGPNRESSDPESRRKVSLVAFLNGESFRSDEGSYRGGSLIFYPIGNEPEVVLNGVALAGRPGLLIAFRSDVLHEVTPVTEGRRYTVVSWFS